MQVDYGSLNLPQKVGRIKALNPSFGFNPPPFRIVGSFKHTNYIVFAQTYLQWKTWVIVFKRDMLLISYLANAFSSVLAQYNGPSSMRCCDGVRIVSSPVWDGEVKTLLCRRRRVVAELCWLVTVVVWAWCSHEVVWQSIIFCVLHA